MEKIMATVLFFWGGGDEKDIIPLDLLPKAKTVKCDRYTEVSEILNARLRLRFVHPARKMS